MKQYLLALIISIGLCYTAGAQSKFSLGPNAGVGGTWVSNLANSKTKLAGNFGLSAIYSATEHFGIGLDAKYSFEGGKSGANALHLNYFRLPLKAIYFFNSYGNSIRPKVFVGPSFGFLNSAKSNNIDVKKSFESFDFGVTAGVGLNLRLVSNTWFNADVNYYHGTSDIQKNTNLHNRNLGVNVGVNFGL